MTKTEAQTRQDIIDNRLDKAGWNVKEYVRKVPDQAEAIRYLNYP